MTGASSFIEWNTEWEEVVTKKLQLKGKKDAMEDAPLKPRINEVMLFHSQLGALNQ